MSLHKSALKTGHFYLTESDDNGVTALREISKKDFDKAISY